MKVLPNFRGWILLVLILHLLVHPMVHGITTFSDSPDSASVSLPIHFDTNTAGSIDHCDLCRVGQTATAAPKPAIVELLNPHWIPVRLQAVSYASLQAASRLPSRAPPTL